MKARIGSTYCSVKGYKLISTEILITNLLLKKEGACALKP
jgi:hypothetical protein